MTASNTGSNTVPSEADRDRMKREHRLSWHPRGGWCRKFPGDANRTYFGKIPAGDAVRAMLREEQRRADGTAAEVKLTNLKVREAANLFLTHLDQQLKTGAIGAAQRASYGEEVDAFVRFAGRNRRLSDFCKLTAPEELFKPLRDAAMARGVFAAEKHVTQIRTFLDWCSSTRRFITAPFYADAFHAPTEKEKRARRKAVRREKGVAFWKPEEVRDLLDAAMRTDVHRTAHVLLMLNGGFGATDLSYLEDGDVDWQRECIHTDRSKTLVPRVVPLWDVTREAMRLSRERRPKPARAEWSTRFFLTMHGRPLVVEELVPHRKTGRPTLRRTDSVKNWFYQTLSGSKATGKRRGVIRLPHLKRHRAGAYTLRSVFTTLTMGHGQDRNLEAIVLGQQFDRPIAEFYIRGDQRAKLVAIVDHVREQIWPSSSSSPARAPASAVASAAPASPGPGPHPTSTASR